MDTTNDALQSECQKIESVGFFCCFHKSVGEQLLTGSLKRVQMNGRTPTLLSKEVFLS